MLLASIDANDSLRHTASLIIMQAPNTIKSGLWEGIRCTRSGKVKGPGQAASPVVLYYAVHFLCPCTGLASGALGPDILLALSLRRVCDCWVIDGGRQDL